MKIINRQWIWALLIPAILVVGYTSYGDEGVCIKCNEEAVKAKPKLAHAELNTAALKAVIGSKVPVVILDARNPGGDAKRIPGAKAISHKASLDEVKVLVKSKDALVVTYCGGGACPLSAKLAASLKKFGYRNVIEYPQGIKGWIKAGLKTEVKGKIAVQ